MLAITAVGLGTAAPASADGLVGGALEGLTTDPVNFVAGTAEGTPALLLSKVAEIAPAPSASTKQRKHRRHRQR